MSAQVVIAKNQTAGDLSLSKLNVTDRIIPASGQVTLTGDNTLYAIITDTELKAYIDGNHVLLNIDGVDLTKAQSQSYCECCSPIKCAPGDMNTMLTEKETATANDLFLIEDSADSHSKKKIKSGKIHSVAASAPGVQAHLIGRLDSGLKTVAMDETLSPSAVETPMTNVVPKGSVIREVLGNCESALTGGGTTVTWSLGTTADPDKYGTAGFPTQADSLAKNSKSNWMAGPLERLPADETIVLTGTITGGASDGNTALTNGSVRIVVIYDTFAELPNAA